MNNKFDQTIKNYCIFLQQFSGKETKTEYSRKLQRKFDDKTLKILDFLYKAEKGLLSNLLREKQRIFRDSIANYINRSEFLKRFLNKPLGYPGDYLMFEMMYEQKPLSSGIGYYFDSFILRYPLTGSMLARKHKIKIILRNLFIEGGARISKIANLGCGSCRELKEFLSENILPNKVLFTLIDQDQEGLFYAKNLMKNNNKKVSLNFIRTSIQRMIGFECALEKNLLNSQDIIYSLGLVDYFSDNVLIKFLRYCYDHLNPNGKLIVGFCSSCHPKIYSLIRWYCDWYFFTRDAKQVVRIVRSEIPNCKPQIVWESNKNVFFLIINKEC